MAAKKTSAKKTTKKMPAKNPAPARKITAVKKPMSKSAIIDEITQNTQLNKKMRVGSKHLQFKWAMF